MSADIERAAFEAAGARLHGWGERDYARQDYGRNQGEYSFSEQRRAFALWQARASQPTGGAQGVDKGPWRAGNLTSGVPFIESGDFAHDVRLYVNGDFATHEQRAEYCARVVDVLNRTTPKD